MMCNREMRALRHIALSVFLLCLSAIPSYAVDFCSQMADANYTVAATDVFICTPLSFSAPRTVFLPAAGGTLIGQGSSGPQSLAQNPTELKISDNNGVVSGSNTLTITPKPGQSINGVTNGTIILSSPLQQVTLYPFSGSSWYATIGSVGGGSGSGTVPSCTANQIGYFASSGNTLACLSTANNGVLITSGAGVPSISSTLPAAVQGNITSLGTIAALLDVEAPSSIGNTGTNSTLARFYAGSSGTPITAITPTFAISRYEALPSGSNTEGGQNGAIYASSIGNNTSSTGNSAQVNVITAVGSQIGSGDVVGFFGSAEQSGTPLGTSHSFAAFGIFTVANVTSNANNQGYGANFVIANSTGTDCPLTSSAFGGYGCGTAGILLQAIGTNLSSVGVELLASGQQFDTGYFIQGGAVKTAGFFDFSSDITSIEIAGSHTYGINLASGTYSTASIAAPGFTVNGVNGDILYTGAAWSQYTPTITAGLGTITGATIASEVSYKVFGKTVVVDGTVIITNVGSGSPSGYLGVSLPASGPTTAASASSAQGITNAATAVNGLLAAAGTNWVFYTYSGGSLWSNDMEFSFSATYESD